MATNENTQAVLDELKAPSHATRRAGESAILAFLPVLTNLAQQAGTDLSLVQMAEIAEADDVLRGRLEGLAQTAKAQRRICGDLERNVRDLITSLRQRERFDADFRPKAVEKGYTG